MKKEPFDLNSPLPILGGVASAMAKSMDMEPVIIRACWILFFICSNGIAVMFYALIMLLSDDEEDDDNKEDSTS